MKPSLLLQLTLPLVLTLTPLSLWANWEMTARKCAMTFQPTNTFRLSNPSLSLEARPSRMTKQEHFIDYKGSQTLEILDRLNRIYTEYHFITITRRSAEIAIPMSYWSRFFKESFEEVSGELKRADIFRTDTYSNNVKEITVLGKLLLDASIKVDRATNDTIYFIRLPAEVMGLIQRLQEPAHARLTLETGLFKSRRYGD